MSTNNKKYGQAWKDRFQDLDLPSGNVCQVRRPGVQGLIKAGVLESMDVLTGLVQQVTLPKAEGKPQVDQNKVMENPKAVNDMLDVLDDIVLYCVNQPIVKDKYKREILLDANEQPTGKLGDRLVDEETGKFIKIPDHERVEWEPTGEDGENDDDANPIFLYVDEVDLEDKMFLMNFVVGGSKDFAPFRAATQEALGGAQSGEAAGEAP